MAQKNIIYERRKELNKTQRDVAEYCGVSTTSVLRWENGDSFGLVKREKLNLLCECLKLDPIVVAKEYGIYLSDDGKVKEATIKAIKNDLKELSLEQLTAAYQYIQFMKKTMK